MRLWMFAVSGFLLSACATAPLPKTPFILLEVADADAVDGVTQVIRRRIVMDGTVEAVVAREGAQRIRIDYPRGAPSGNLQEQANALARMGALTLNLVDQDADLAAYALNTTTNGRVRLAPMDPRMHELVVFADPMVTASDIAMAEPLVDESGAPAIAFTLTPGGSERFGTATRRNVGRVFAIVLDGLILSAPRILTPIYGGNGRITGPFTTREATQLAKLLRSGALPAPVSVVATGAP